jgi:N12 class adenine-specific DNA methylase
MINTKTVTNIIQDEINKSTDSSVTKVLFSIKSRINDLEENDLNNLYKDYLQREIADAEKTRNTNRCAEKKLLSELFS